MAGADAVAWVDILHGLEQERMLNSCAEPQLQMSS